MSPAVARKSPTGRHSSRRSLSPEREYSPPRRRDRDRERERSPVKSSRSGSPSHRERSPSRPKSSHRDRDKDRDRDRKREKERGRSPARERHSSRAKSPKREKSSSPPVSRSQSPRTKRLRRAHSEREAEKAPERPPRGRNHEKGSDKSKHERNHRERDLEDEVPKDRRDRRSDRDGERERERERDVADAGSSRSRHRRSASPTDRHHHRSRHHSRSPSNFRARDEDANSQEAEYGDDVNDSLLKMKAAEQALTAKEKNQPSFELSGKLAAETNRVRGITLLFNEPPDARKPDVRWRLYVFKGGEVLNEPLYVHRQSCYLFGRERRIADIPTDHPSCSKQHAVLQFRQVEKEQPDGMMSKQVRIMLLKHNVTMSSLRRILLDLAIVVENTCYYMRIPPNLLQSLFISLSGTNFGRMLEGFALPEVI